MQATAVSCREVVFATGLLLALSSIGAQGGILRYEMLLDPSAEPVPMTKVNGGFGSPTHDFPPNGTAGLSGDGVASFADSGAHGKHGYYVTGLTTTFTIDMRVRANKTVLPAIGMNRWPMAIYGGLRGCGILAEPGGLTLVSGTAPLTGGTVSVDLRAFHTIRIVVADNKATVYDLENDLDPGPGRQWAVLMNSVALATSGVPFPIEVPSGGLSLNTLDLYDGAPVMQSDFTLDFLRIDAGSDRGGTGGLIRPVQPPLCGELFADTDGDHDVDQDDFGAFQLCFTGVKDWVSDACGCFDRFGDGHVDQVDLDEFENCATGPAIQWSMTVTPACSP